MKNNTLATLLLSVFIALLGIGIIIPIMPVFARELGASGFALGMIIAVFSVTRGVLLPLVGHLSDRWGRKRFLAAGLCIYGLVGLLIPLAASIEQLIFIRSFHGIGSAMIVPVAMAFVSMLSPEGGEGRYMSYLNIAIFCGIGCGPVIGGLVYDAFDFATVFHLMAALSFVAFLLVLGNMPADTAVPAPARSLLQSFRLMAADGRTGGVLLARFSTMIVMVPTMAFLPLIMARWQDSTGLQVGIVIAGRTLVNAVLQVPFGRFADRGAKLLLLTLSTTAMAATVLCIPLMESFAAMLALYFLLGAEEAAVWAVLGAYASIEAKARYGHGTMMGVFSLAMSAGVFTGAVLAGSAMDRWGIASAYRVSCLAVLLFSLAAAWMIGLHERRERLAEPH